MIAPRPGRTRTQSTPSCRRPYGAQTSLFLVVVGYDGNAWSYSHRWPTTKRSPMQLNSCILRTTCIMKSASPLQVSCLPVVSDRVEPCRHGPARSSIPTNCNHTHMADWPDAALLLPPLPQMLAQHQSVVGWTAALPRPLQTTRAFCHQLPLPWPTSYNKISPPTFRDSVSPPCCCAVACNIKHMRISPPLSPDSLRP